MKNTKPNRDITAEEPTTSTEWEGAYRSINNILYNFGFCLVGASVDMKLKDQHYEQIIGIVEGLIQEALTTRTNELLGAMKMEKIGQNVILNCVSRNDYKKSYEYCVYNNAVEEFNKKLAALREKYGQR